MWKPTSIVFGVRHKKLFSFLDYAGKVLDSVIEMQEAGDLPGGPSFENVGWQRTVAQLQDAKGLVTVNFDVDGIVLTVDSRSGMRSDAAKRLIQAVAKKVLSITGGDDRVDRIGTAETYRFDHRASGAAAVSALTSLNEIAGVGSAGDVAMRVSFRSPTEQGLANEDIKDWRNLIVQVWNRRNEEPEPDPHHLHVTIDYQTYFDPERPFGASLIEDHYRRFLSRLESLQTGRLADLVGEQVVQ
jgi:hypothetical protein